MYNKHLKIICLVQFIAKKRSYQVHMHFESQKETEGIKKCDMWHEPPKPLKSTKWWPKQNQWNLLETYTSDNFLYVHLVRC